MPTPTAPVSTIQVAERLKLYLGQRDINYISLLSGEGDISAEHWAE